MTDRENLAKSLAVPRRSFKTARAVIRVTRERRAYRASQERARRRSEELFSLVVAGVEDDRRHTRVDEVWFEPPRRLRIATDGQAIVMCDGSRGWLREPSQPIWTSVPIENVGRKASLALLRPGLVVDGLILEVIDDVRVIGRAGKRVYARHGAAPPDWHDDGGLAPFADEYDLVIDTETGVILSAVARALGKVIASTTVREIAFDEVFAATLFRPDPGDEVRPIEALFDHRLESLKLSETPTRVEFPVWGLDRMPESWTVEAGYWPPLADWSQPPRIVLIYASPDGRKFINLLESPTPEGAGGGESARHAVAEGGRLVERRGTQYFVTSAASRGTVINFNRGRTAIRMEAEGIAEGDLLSIAASLREVEGDG